MIALQNSLNSANSANATLNVNELGAKPIYYKGAQITANQWPSKAISLFVYNTTDLSTGCWSMVWSYGQNTTYTNASLGQGYGTCSTAAATKAKVVSLSSYALTVGGIVAVKFDQAVSVAGATLNINSKGAKNIYYRGALITADIIEAGDLVTFIYDGTQYQVLSIDRGAEVADKVKNAVTFQGTSGDKTFDGSTAQTITYSDVNALPANTMWAKGSSQGGNAAVADKTKATLTFGTSGTTFNGSTNVTVTAADLGLSQAISFRGILSSNVTLTDGAKISPVILSNNSSLTPIAGDVVIDSVQSAEFIWTGEQWEHLGQDGSYALNTISVTGANGLTGGGNLTQNRTISHAENSVSDSAATTAPTTYIASVSADKYGHLASYTTYDAREQFLRSISVSDDNVINVSGSYLSASASTTPTLDFSHAITGSAAKVKSDSAKATPSASPSVSLGAGDTGYIIVPQISVDIYGHTKFTGEEEIAFSIPDPKATLLIQTSTAAATSATVSVTYSATGSDKTITIPKMKGATGSAVGYQGLVPAPAAGDNAKFLRGDGTWQYSVEWVDFDLV